MADTTVYDQQKRRIAELEEAIASASNRIEAATLGNEVCFHCLELAQSYLRTVMPPSQL